MLIFHTNNFTVMVCEDIPIGTVITIITAMDPDVSDKSTTVLTES